MADIDAVKCKAIDSSVLTTSTDEGDCINIIDSNGRQNSGEPDPTDSGYNSTPDETRKWYKLVEPQIVRIEEKKGAILPEPPDSGYSWTPVTSLTEHQYLNISGPMPIMTNTPSHEMQERMARPHLYNL